MARLLFESTWLLGAIWLGALLPAAALWSLRRSRATVQAVWAVLLIGPILIVLSILVVTPREEIERTIRRLAKAVDDGNMLALKEGLAEEFTADSASRGEFLERVERTLTKHAAENVRVFAFDAQTSPEGRAEVEFTATATVRIPEVAWEWVSTRWRLRLRRANGRWLVTEVQMRASPSAPALSDLLRSAP